MKGNLKAGARWLILIVIASVWVEAIRDNLWWIIMTFVIAGIVTMIVGFLVELERQKYVPGKRDDDDQ